MMEKLKLILIGIVFLWFQLFGWTESTENDEIKLDAIELTAKLLIDLDEKIEECLGVEKVKTVDKFSQLYIPPNENEIASVREEKFSEVLRDLAKLETQIQEAITQANSNRRFLLVARLRPLLNYVTHIRRNMDLLRNRVVAVTTLSTIAFTVNEVVDQFADVMTSTLGMPPNLVLPSDRLTMIPIKERNNTTDTSTSDKPQLVPQNTSTVL
jgi:hypothetical protein